MFGTKNSDQNSSILPLTSCIKYDWGPFFIVGFVALFCHKTFCWFKKKSLCTALKHSCKAVKTVVHSSNSCKAVKTVVHSSKNNTVNSFQQITLLTGQLAVIYKPVTVFLLYFYIFLLKCRCSISVQRCILFPGSSNIYYDNISKVFWYMYTYLHKFYRGGILVIRPITRIV